MIIIMPEHKMKRSAERLRKILQEHGIDFWYTQCLDLISRLHGFEKWQQYLRRDLSQPLSPLDENLSDNDFAARDAFQMSVLEAVGLGSVGRELLDRVNPTGSWAKAEPTEKSRCEDGTGNDPGRWSAERRAMQSEV
jgi:hypothetical protein